MRWVSFDWDELFVGCSVIMVVGYYFSIFETYIVGVFN